MKTLAQFRNHPAVQEIILESDHGRRLYWINLKAGFATDGGMGQTSGSETTLSGVAAFLESVAAVPAKKPAAHDSVSHLRAFIAYAETTGPGVCFTLIPYHQAIAAGIPFSETLVHEGLEWAVFLAGDCSPCDMIALEQAGVIDVQ